MGVGQLSIGIGKGGAQVFGNNPAIDQFADMLAQRKAKQDKDNQFLNDQLAQNYDPSSLRNDADKQSYLKQYQTIRDQAIAAENEQNPHKKALAISEVRQQLGNLGAYAEGSKKQGLMEKQLAMEFMKNPDHYEDDSVDKYKSGLQKEWKDPDIISNASQVERRVDPNKLAEDYNKFKTDQIKPTQWSNGTHKVYNFDGKKKEVIEQNRGVPIDGDNGAYELMLHKASADPKWSKGLKDLYPDVQTGDKTQDLALRVRKYMHDQGDTQGWYDKPKEISMEGQTPDRFYSHYNYELAHPKAGTSASNLRTPTQIMIAGDTDPQTGQKKTPGIVDNNPEAIQKFVSLLPKGQYGDKFDPSSVVKVDPQTGVQTWTFPEQVKVDDKVVAKNAIAKKNYEDAGGKEGGFLGFGGKKVPWEQSDAYKALHKDPYKQTAPAKSYTVDPNSPDATSKIAEMGVEQHVNFKTLNDAEGQKSGHGQIKEAQAKNSQYSHTQSGTDSKGNQITIGYKNGKWYDTKTNKPIE